MPTYVIISSVPNTAKLCIAFVTITFFQESQIIFQMSSDLGLKSGYNDDSRFRPFPTEAIYGIQWVCLINQYRFLIQLSYKCQRSTSIHEPEDQWPCLQQLLGDLYLGHQKVASSVDTLSKVHTDCRLRQMSLAIIWKIFPLRLISIHRIPQEMYLVSQIILH